MNFFTASGLLGRIIYHNNKMSNTVLGRVENENLYVLFLCQEAEKKAGATRKERKGKIIVNFIKIGMRLLYK